jgi:phosphohistidine swiveling domain-containing protein
MAQATKSKIVKTRTIGFGRFFIVVPIYLLLMILTWYVIPPWYVAIPVIILLGYFLKKGYRKGKVNTLQAITAVGAMQRGIQLGSETSMLWFPIESTSSLLNFPSVTQMITFTFKERCKGENSKSGFNAFVSGSISWRIISAPGAASHGSKAEHLRQVEISLRNLVTQCTSSFIGDKTPIEVDTNKEGILQGISRAVEAQIAKMDGYNDSDTIIGTLAILVSDIRISEIEIEKAYEEVATLEERAHYNGRANVIKAEKMAEATKKIDELIKDPKESARIVQRMNKDISTEEKIISINDEDGALTAAAAILGIASNNENMVEMIEQSGLLKKGFLSSKKKGSSSSSSSLDKDDKSKK